MADGALCHRRRDGWAIVLAYVEQILAPTLRKGDTVFMDNLRTQDRRRSPGGRSGRRQGALLRPTRRTSIHRNGILELKTPCAGLLAP